MPKFGLMPQHVSLGVKRLNMVCWEWWRYVDRDNLNMGCGNNNLLGQLVKTVPWGGYDPFGLLTPYEAGAIMVFPEYGGEVPHLDVRAYYGFTILPDSHSRAFTYLTEHWLGRIRYFLERDKEGIRPDLLASS